VAGPSPRDASRVGPGVKLEVCPRVAGDLARREVLEVDGVDKRGSGDSRFVEGDEESVSGESTTAEEVILIIDGETDSRGVLRVGVTVEGSTIAAEAVKVGIKCLRRAGTIYTREMRRSRPDATIHMSLC
jgi:hypothetical protein